MRKTALSTLADFLINIAAAWFVAIIATIFLPEPNLLLKILVLTANSISVIVSLLIAIWLRRKK